MAKRLQKLRQEKIGDGKSLRPTDPDARRQSFSKRNLKILLGLVRQGEGGFCHFQLKDPWLRVSSAGSLSQSLPLSPCPLATGLLGLLRIHFAISSLRAFALVCSVWNAFPQIFPGLALDLPGSTQTQSLQSQSWCLLAQQPLYSAPFSCSIFLMAHPHYVYLPSSCQL